MPYITEDDKRQAADDYRDNVGPKNAGVLTYEFQETILEYLYRHGLRYQQIAEVLGALEGAKLDFIKRVVDPYEDRQKKANGDVWPPCYTGGI